LHIVKQFPQCRPDRPAGVALMAFPGEPLIHLIMVIEPLIELPDMMLITRILLVIRKQRMEKHL
jgi:hypothetical protein